MAGERWLFTKSQIANTPSRKNDIDSDKELSYRQQAANFIQDMGQRLQVNQLCINTAIVYMHRFYMFHSFARFHRNSIAAASLFLGAKVEEQPRKLEHVITIAHKCLNREAPPLDTKSEAYLERAQELVINEGVLLQTLGFEIKVDHPHTYVVKTCDLVRASKDLAQTSYFLATNSLHLTTLCLQTKPTVVACVCIHLACKWSNWEFPRSSEGKDWFWYVDKDVNLETLEGFTQEFLTILDNCPSRLKRKIMTWKNAAQERDPQGEKRARPSGMADSSQSNFPTIAEMSRPGGTYERHGSKSVASTPVQSGSRSQQSTPDSRKKIKIETTPTTTTTSYKDYKERKERERIATGETSRHPHHRTSQMKPELPLDRHVKSEGTSLEFHQRLPDVKPDMNLLEHDHRRNRLVKTESPASLHMGTNSGKPNIKVPPTKERSQPDLQELSQLSSSHHRHKHSHKSKDQSRETRPDTGHPPLKLKLSNRHTGTNGNKPDSRTHSATKHSQRPGESVQLTSPPSNSVSQKQMGDSRSKNSSHFTAGSLGMVPHSHSQEAKAGIERPSPTGYSSSQRHSIAYRDSPDMNSHSSSTQPASWHGSSYNQASFVSDLSSVGISPSPVKARKRGPSPAAQPRQSPYKHPKKEPPNASAMFGSQMFTPPSLESGEFKASLGEYPRFLGTELGAQNPEANGSDVGSPHFPVVTPSKENLNAIQMQLQHLIEVQKTHIAKKQQDYTSSSSGGYMSDCQSMPPLPGQELGSIPPLPSTPPNLPPLPPPPPPPPF